MVKESGEHPAPAEIAVREFEPAGNLVAENQATEAADAKPKEASADTGVDGRAFFVLLALAVGLGAIIGVVWGMIERSRPTSRYDPDEPDEPKDERPRCRTCHEVLPCSCRRDPPDPPNRPREDPPDHRTYYQRHPESVPTG